MKKLVLLVILLVGLSASAFAGVGYNVDLVGSSKGLLELEPTVGYYNGGYGIGAWLGMGNQGVAPGWFLSKTLISDAKNSTGVSIGHAYPGANLGLSVSQEYKFDSTFSVFGRASYTGYGDVLLMLATRWYL